MLKTTIAGLKARTARMILSSIAIILGVAFVSGTLILGNALDANVRGDFARQTKGVDVAVQLGDKSTENDKITQSMVDQVRKVPGVAGADGRMGATAPLVRGDGKAKPISLYSLEDTPALREFDLKDGRFPATADEIAIDTTTAQTAKLAVGQKVSVLAPDDKPVPLTVVGTYTQGTSKSTMYGDQGVMLPTGLLPLTKSPSFYQIVVAAAPGVSQQDLTARVQTALAQPNLTFMTGADLTAKTLAQVSRGSSGLTQFMLVFAVIALIVAAMVIYNTFTILVAQRTRELALLRCIGANRGQVFRSVLLEALVMGLFASVLGLGAGIGLSALLQSGIGSLTGGAGGPIQIPITPTVVLAAFGVGVLVTVVSAALPALRATRVAPLAALRTVPDSHDEVKRTGVVRLVFVGLLAAAGAGLCFMGMGMGGGGGGGSEQGFIITGVGTMVLLLAVIVLGPVIVGPVNRLLGAVPKLVFGVPAKLATANAGRNPKRTAATTAALMIGVTIVTMITVVATSAKQSATAEIDKRFPTDYVVSSSSYDRPLPASLADQLSKVDQVEFVSPMASYAASVGTGDKSMRMVSGIAANSIGKTFNPKVSEGDLGTLATGGIALSASTVKTLGVKLGDEVPTSAAGPRGTASSTTKLPLKLLAIYEDGGGQSAAGVITLQTLAKIAPTVTGYTEIMVKTKPGVTPEAGQAAVEKATQSVSTAEVTSAAAQKSKIVDQIDQLLALMWALVGLAVIIALFGIANTLSLSVLERARESALLRALGLTKGQLGGMLLIESVLIGLMGAVIGVLLGGGFAKLLVSALSTDKLELSFAVPYGQMGILLAVAVVAAIIAALLPARRAARTSIVGGMAEA